MGIIYRSCATVLLLLHFLHGSSCSMDPTDREILQMTIFAEARGEPLEGQKAVAWVIKNRADLNRSYWGGSRIKDVCLKYGQFSCWNNGRQPIEEAICREPGAYDAIGQWIDHVFWEKDPTYGSDHFNNPDIEGYPEWTKNCRRTVKIGLHQFYKGP